MNERGQYGQRAIRSVPTWSGKSEPPPAEPEPPAPWRKSLTRVLIGGAWLGVLGYAAYALVKGKQEDRKWKASLAEEKRLIAAWPPAIREKWDTLHETDARLSVGNFEDWLKTGHGKMSVTEWLRSKGRWV